MEPSLILVIRAWLGEHLFSYFMRILKEIEARVLSQGSLIELPAIKGFILNENANPQTTSTQLVWDEEVNAWGNYAWLVFPEVDYYIVASKEGYQDYTSPIISVECNAIKHDIQLEPISVFDELAISLKAKLQISVTVSFLKRIDLSFRKE